MSGNLFNFQINEVLDSIINLTVGSSLKSSKIGILYYANGIVLLASDAHALQVMLDTPSDRIRTLSLKFYVQKSWHIV